MNNAASAGSVTLALYGVKPPIANFDVLKKQMNVFSPLKDGYTPELPGSLYTMPVGVRVAFPISHHKQPPYIRYTMDTGVLLWACTACRTGLSYWLLCCECLKPLHKDCSFSNCDSINIIGAHDYIYKKCHYML
jgi:hypothetical protein